jgi:hypothetical protein
MSEPLLLLLGDRGAGTALNLSWRHRAATCGALLAVCAVALRRSRFATAAPAAMIAPT